MLVYPSIIWVGGFAFTISHRPQLPSIVFHPFCGTHCYAFHKYAPIRRTGGPFRSRACANRYNCVAEDSQSGRISPVAPTSSSGLVVYRERLRKQSFHSPQLCTALGYNQTPSVYSITAQSYSVTPYVPHPHFTSVLCRRCNTNAVYCRFIVGWLILLNILQ